MQRFLVWGSILGSLLIAARTSAGELRCLGEGPYWVPASFPLPEAGTTEDDVSGLLFDLRNTYYKPGQPLPLQIPLLALWLDEAETAENDFDFARDHDREVPAASPLLRALVVAREATYGKDALTRQELLEEAREQLRRLDGRAELSDAARVDRALIELELGERALADSLANATTLATDVRQVLREGSWTSGLGWRGWSDLCEEALASGDVATLGGLLGSERLRAAAFQHGALDAALVPDGRARLHEVDVCLASLPDSAREASVQDRAARQRALEAGLPADAGLDQELGFAQVHDLPVLEGLCKARLAETYARGQRYEQAISALDSAQAICNAHADLYLDYKIQSIRRDVAYNTGDVSTLRATVDAWDDTLTRYRAVDPMNDVARGLLETLLGNPHDGERYLTRAYERSLRRRSVLYRALALENLAFTYATVDEDARVMRYTDALEHLWTQVQDRELLVSRRDSSEVRDAVTLGRTLRAVSDVKAHRAPTSTFDDLSELCVAMGMPRSSVEVHLAASRALADDPEQARRHAVAARDLADEVGAADLHWKACALEGLAEMHLGELAMAHASLDSAIACLGRLRRQASREDVRARFNIPARFVFGIAIELAILENDPTKAYRLDEEGRARTLLDRMTPSPAHEREVATVDSVQATLDPDTLLLQMRVEADRVRIWAVSRDDLRYCEAAVADTTLTQRITGRVHALQDGVPSSDDEGLYDLLLGPVAPELSTHGRLVIVPDGPLRALPFVLLKGPEKRLLQTHVLSYEISGSVRCRTAPRTMVFPPDSRPVLVGSNQDVMARGYHVARRIDATGECESVAAQLRDPLPLLDADATVERLLQARPRASLLHFACHAAFDAGGRAFLQLTADRGDGRLRAPDIQALDLHHVGMVTLSACETALPQSLGADWSPGDLAGLATSFLAAGVPGVVATMWEIDDADAREIMTDFYRNLRTMDPAHALCEAQRAIAARAPSISARIGGWGAFCVYGTPKAP